MIANEKTNGAGPLIERVNDAIRDNPLAAGLIGAGIAWMIFGTKGFGTLGNLANRASTKVATGVKSAGAVAGGAVQSALSAGQKFPIAVKENAAQVTGMVNSLVPDFSIADSASEAADALTSTAIEYGAAIKSELSASLERQPLLIAAIGLAIGAGIASTFPSTPIESEWMGTKGAAARKNIEGFVDQAKNQSAKVAAEIQEEATRQGLTLASVEKIGTKVGSVASDARESVAGRLNGSASESPKTL